MPSWGFPAVLTALAVCLGSPAAAQHYTGCLAQTDTGTSASVVVPDSVTVQLPDDVPLRAGDEIALFTPDSVCAGRRTWRSGDASFTIVVTGPNSSPTPDGASGYEDGEKLRMEIWDASAATEYEVGTALTYAACGPDAPLCRDDGVYETGTIHTIDQIGGETLPVDFAGVRAVRLEERVRLSWTTTREVDNAGFQVQHRGPSASDWSVLDFVAARDTSSGPTRYRYVTARLPPGRHAFRLRQVDRDGTASLSRTVTVRLSLQSPYTLSPVRPNPLRGRGTATLRVRRRQRVQVTLYNVLGQRVSTLLDRTLSPGVRHPIPVRAAPLSSGSYFLRVQGADFETSRRVVVTQ